MCVLTGATAYECDVYNGEREKREKMGGGGGKEILEEEEPSESP